MGQVSLLMITSISLLLIVFLRWALSDGPRLKLRPGVLVLVAHNLERIEVVDYGLPVFNRVNLPSAALELFYRL
jgi:hypothetical protein